MHADHRAPLAAVPGTECPTAIEQPSSAALGELTLMNRVGRVLQDLAAEREVSDAELRQHAADCTSLMEAAYARFQASGNPHDRDEAHRWMHQRDEALRIFSRRGATFVDMGR